MLLQRFNLSRQESKFFLGKLICNIYESSTLVNLYRKIIFLSGAFQYLLSFKTSWYCLYLTRIFFRCFLNLVYFFTFIFHLTFGAMACSVVIVGSKSLCGSKVDSSFHPSRSMKWLLVTPENLNAKSNMSLLLLLQLWVSWTFSIKRGYEVLFF